MNYIKCKQKYLVREFNPTFCVCIGVIVALLIGSASEGYYVDDEAFFLEHNNFTEKEINDYKFDKERFVKALVPDILDGLNNDFNTVYVKFKNILVNTGKILKPTQMSQSPNVYWNAKKSTLYSLAIIDADVPSRHRPVNQAELLWLLINIHENNLDTGFVLDYYIRPKPLKGSGLHRVALLIYQQPERITISDEYKYELRTHRLRFSLSSFADSFSLGNAVGGNVWFSEWDYSVGHFY